MMQVSREKLLASLKLASRGLSNAGMVDQSNCFVFGGGKICTFNGEIGVEVDDPCKIEGVVPVELLRMVEKFSGDVITVEQSPDKKELLLRGKGARAGISCVESDVSPAADVPKPQEWMDVTQEFVKDLLSASKVCGHDEAMGVTMCVRVGPNRIEACDNYRAIRIDRDNGFSSELFIAAANVHSLNGLAVAKVAVVDGWIHFRVGEGVVTLRGRAFDTYPDLDDLMNTTGEEVSFPKELCAGIECARITLEGGGSSFGHQQLVARVAVVVRKDEAKITSSSGVGWYEETFSLKYGGKDVAFDAHPESLLQILDQSFVLQVGAGKLIAKSDCTTMVIATQVPK